MINETRVLNLIKFALADLEGLYGTQTTVYNPYFGKSQKFAPARQTMIEINDLLLELGQGYQTDWFREWVEAGRPDDPTGEQQ